MRRSCGKTHTQVKHRVYQVRPRLPACAQWYGPGCRMREDRMRPPEASPRAKELCRVRSRSPSKPCAACAGRRRPRPSRSKARAPKADAAARSGTTSSRPPAPSATAPRLNRAPTASTATRRTSTCSRALGVDRYRFSISWVRVQPTRHGTGERGGHRLLRPRRGCAARRRRDAVPDALPLGSPHAARAERGMARAARPPTGSPSTRRSSPTLWATG